MAYTVRYWRTPLFDAGDYLGPGSVVDGTLMGVKRVHARTAAVSVSTGQTLVAWPNQGLQRAPNDWIELDQAAFESTFNAWMGRAPSAWEGGN